MWSTMLLMGAMLLPGQDAKPEQKQDAKPEQKQDAKPEQKQDAKPAKKDGQLDKAALRDKVNRLIRQLDADDLIDRDTAERELTELGAVILDLLPATDAGTPAEVRQRLARIANAIESSAANITSEPSTVTLEGKMRLDDAMTEMQLQTGNRFESASEAEVTTDFKNLNYFEALDKLLDQARMNVNPYGGTSGVLTLVERPEGEGNRADNATYAGVFRVEPLRVQAVRNIRNPTVQGCRVAMRMEWEPRVRPVSISQPLDAVTAVDDLGNQLSIEGQGNRGSEVQPGVAGLEIELPFSLPDRKATKIASLKGRMTALIPGRVETFQFDRRLDKARGMELRKAGATVVLDRVRKNGNLYQVLIRVRFDEAREALESHRGWILQNEAFIIDSKGERVENAGLEQTRRSNEEVGVAYQFPLPEGIEGCRFIYRTPALIIEMPVDYEVKDIPLP